MSKLTSIKSTLLIILFIFFLVLLPKEIFAASCDLSLEPSTQDQNMGTLKVTVKSTDLTSGKYEIILTTPASAGVTSTKEVDFDAVNGATAEFPRFTGTGWLAGEYKLGLIAKGQPRQQSSAICSKTFTINPTPAQSCIASIITKPISPIDPVILELKNLTRSNQQNPDFGDQGYDILVNNQVKSIYSTDSGETIDLGTYPTATYIVSVKNRCGFAGAGCLGKPAQLQCPLVAFEVAPIGSGQGGEISPDKAVPIPKATSCTDPKKCTSSGGKDFICDGDAGIKTAIGCVHTTPAGFVKDFIAFAIGIGGGLAFLMMLLGAFQMLTSAGNPETLQAGRDRFQSAIIGLLFVIFAVLLLQIIGVGILNIPGFT